MGSEPGLTVKRWQRVLHGASDVHTNPCVPLPPGLPLPRRASRAVCIVVGEFVGKSRAVPGAGAGGSVNVSVWGTQER